MSRKYEELVRAMGYVRLVSSVEPGREVCSGVHQTTLADSSANRTLSIFFHPSALSLQAHSVVSRTGIVVMETRRVCG